MAKKIFDPEKELKKIQRKGFYNPKTRMFVILGVVVATVLLGSTYALFSSESIASAFNSKVSKTVSVNVASENGEIASTMRAGRDNKIIYNTSTEYYVMPKKGYIYDKVLCTNNQQAVYDVNTNILNITPTKDTTCTVIFKEAPSLANIILENNSLNIVSPDFKTNEENGFFSSEDNLGTSYYFRGEVENNYVQFGEYKSKEILYYLIKSQDNKEYYFKTREEASNSCSNYNNYGFTDQENCNAKIEEIAIEEDKPILWRITRLNGDSSVRLITNDIVATSAYKDINNTDIIFSKLEDWYNINLKDQDEKIVLGNYCSDNLGLERITNNTITFKCLDENISNSKIGLSSVDELNYAGLLLDKKDLKNNYLYSPNYWFWSMSLYNENTNFVAGYKFDDLENKGLGFKEQQINIGGLRPVINLSKDIKITSGDGTLNNPYIID